MSHKNPRLWLVITKRYFSIWFSGRCYASFETRTKIWIQECSWFLIIEGRRIFSMWFHGFKGRESAIWVKMSRKTINCCRFKDIKHVWVTQWCLSKINGPKNCSKNHLKDATPKWQPFSKNSQMHQILTNLLIATDILNNDVVKTAVAVQRGKPWEISNILSRTIEKNKNIFRVNSVEN